MDSWKLLRVLIFLCIYILSSKKLQGAYGVLPVATPFFFICQYQGDTNQAGLTQGEVAVSVTIQGNPDFYEPGKIYEVVVASSAGFDGFMMTGIYTLPDSAAKQMLPVFAGLGHKSLTGQYPVGQSMMCAIVHSHVSHQPSKTLSFLWMAPPAGTGCVNFLATATLGQEIMFKDTLVLQLCEARDDKKEDLELKMTGIHTSGVILRENFEMGNTPDSSVWSNMINGEISDQCGNIIFGKSASFCGTSSSRSLVTVSLNTTTATTLQFALGVGNCNIGIGDPPIDILYGVKKCTKWYKLDSVQLQSFSETVVHILCLPLKARSSDTCFKWFQEAPKNGRSLHGCWAVDNIIISNAADSPTYLEDKFDPVDPGNWLFFPGGVVKRKCHSDGDALVFNSHQSKNNYVTTRNLDLSLQIPKEDIIFEEDFEYHLNKQWTVEGGAVSHQCGIIYHKKAIVMSGTTLRRICTPFMDTSKVGNLRFYLAHGGSNCTLSQMHVAHDAPISVYVESNLQRIFLADALHISGMDANQISLPVWNKAQLQWARFCWHQTIFEGKDKDVWAIDHIQLLPWLPSNISHVVQFRLNLQCGGNATENSVAVQFSPNHGHSWDLLHELCLPPNCKGSHSAIVSYISSYELKGWSTVSFPLPYVILISGARIRFIQQGSLSQSNWAIDNVFIGPCPNACNGHGKCTVHGCKCDMGYSGHSCENAVVSNPGFFSELFSSPLLQSNPNIIKISGAGLGYHCGSLGSGKAVVFDKSGPRQLITREINTTKSRFLQFTVRLGTPSSSSICPAPNYPIESVYVHYSCDGGLQWELLETLHHSKVMEPRHISFLLPKEAQKPACFFKIWQANHSGDGRDVWALDDITLSNKLYNVINLNFSNVLAINDSIRYNSGTIKKHCLSEGNALSFEEEVYSGSSRSLETRSLNVGPGYMLQFDLVMGCGRMYSRERDNKVHLEYSVNHGMNWQPVYNPCLPSTGGCNGVYTKGTVYDASEYKKWKRVTISLPPATWSTSTRFRFRQPDFETGDTWAVDNLYIGPQCPDLCSGHGRCVDGTCICDDHFYGKNCLPKDKLKRSMTKRFESMEELEREGFDVSGGTVITAGDGCGIITSGASIYFYQEGIRQLVTADVDSKNMDFAQFFIRIGGGDPITCNNASERNESVLFQFSNDAGITWSLLRELYSENYRSPRMEHITLPAAARTSSTRLRWWQPQHSGEGKDQWALDDLYLDTGSHPNAQGGEHNVTQLGQMDMWSAMTRSSMQYFCGSPKKVVVFDGPEKWKFVISKPLDLVEEHVIMFKINVGCSSRFNWESAVRLEYSHDFGVSWKLVMYHCYPASGCTGSAHEASVYYSGPHGNWTRILIPVTHELAQNQTLLRWVQDFSYLHMWTPSIPFSLAEVYVGTPCPNHCSGHGQCTLRKCICDPGYEGSHCFPSVENPSGMTDRFDESTKPSHFWVNIHGGSLGTGCGNLSLGQSLYFGEDGYRLAQTRDFNTQYLRTVQFVAQVGSVLNLPTCHKPQHNNENVFVQYSNNHGLSWNFIRELDHKVFNKRPVSVVLDIPVEARTDSTSFRWWQPLGKWHKDKIRAEWAVDNVMILGSYTNAQGFQDNFDPMKINDWFVTHHGTPKISCQSKGNALIFSANHDETGYAETWDFEVNTGTFLQFDINMRCSYPMDPFNVRVEYSIDRGRSWSLVTMQCLPPKVGCNGYHPASILLSEQYGNWTRVTTYLPQRAISPATRFRWMELSETHSDQGHSWAIDNVYLGDGCPWMCSGHGYCDRGKCVCDPGFTQANCVPSISLPCELKDTFDIPVLNKDLWPEVYGAEISTRCGILVSGSALSFYKEGIRMMVTRDLDLTSAQYIQFIFKYGCRGSVPSNVTRGNGILLQYSNNGGITWHLLKELHYPTEIAPSYFIVPIVDPSAKTNATRLRLWQPHHGGFGVMEWAVDDIFVGGMASNPNVLYDPLDNLPQADAWLFWPGGKMGTFCAGNDNRQSIIFESSEGVRAVYTKDMVVAEDYIIQFEIKVGCGTITLPEEPIHLEYSVDQGRSWRLVKVPWVPYSRSPDCLHQVETPSVYYSNAHPEWQKIVIPLKGLQICGTVRFRWHQGCYSLRDSPPNWALDHIYIGPSCALHCMGHGTCINGIMCICDPGYDGDFCHRIVPNANFLKDSFEGPQIDRYHWEHWSGAEISRSCGILISGPSLVFTYQGERMLVSRDLDLTQVSAVHFYLRLGCGSHLPTPEEQPILFQHSIDGGAVWHMIEEFNFGEDNQSPHPVYVVIELPNHARTNSTKLRWWQPSFNGTFLEEWAIDQIFVGGDVNGMSVLNDDFSVTQDANWILNPGATLETICGSQNNFLHFKGSDNTRYAVTTDVVVGDQTYIQFEIAMGCRETSACYEVALEYSTDMGKTWALVRQQCLPSNVDCSDYFEASVYRADIHYSITRVTLPLPYYTRSSSTRFQWIQHPAFKASQTWAIGQLYIGDECAEMCSGHGRCDRGACRCSDGWTGIACHIPKSQLPKELRDNFTNNPAPLIWLMITGGATSDLCGPVASGSALHFYGPCTRQLITRDLDLQNATVVQFYFRYGCISQLTSSDQNVFLQASTNGGITWITLKEMIFTHYQSPGYVAVPLPHKICKNGVRLRWWQAQHQGRAHNDWAVDSVYIGGNTLSPEKLMDFRDGYFLQLYQWLTYNNIAKGHYCSSSELVAIGDATGIENATLETIDLNIKENYVLEFSFAVGCNASWNDPGVPVHLQFSVDFGLTWTYLVSQCLPSQLACAGHAQRMSLYYAPSNWQRIVIPLTGKAISRWTRFRWHQQATQESFTSHQWALKQLYIGPACPNNCHGHGACYQSNCVCDKGYSGKFCEGSRGNPIFIKDTFSFPKLDYTSWLYVAGGRVSNPCSTLVEGTALVFSGSGPRLVETVDLDLRDAKFVQYTIQLGGKGDNLACIPPSHRNQSILLQYSVDGGISWIMLHEMDYILYAQPQRDYLLLPEAARTTSTRLRWWQATSAEMSFGGSAFHVLDPVWALDNVYIGGLQINPHELLDDFDNDSGGIDEKNWWFYPYAKLQSKYCFQTKGNALVWSTDPDIDERIITTQELIVGEGFMIHFRIVVGCGESHHQCTTNHSVRLEYTKEPGSGLWDLVHKACLPSNSLDPECSPYQFYSATEYSANSHNKWTLVTLLLPDQTFSSTTQFRWIQSTPDPSHKPVSAPSWALDDVYIGEACSSLCRGRGICLKGTCHCDPEYSGEDCQPSKNAFGGSLLPTTFLDGFEVDISGDLWSTVLGGRIGIECGSLAPHGHGKHLHFGGCGLRHAVTKDLDTTLASKLMFVLRIGSEDGSPHCHINLNSPLVADKGILLQYSVTGGSSWELIAIHPAQDFLQPRRLVYDIPEGARTYGVQFRWWQPYHEGTGQDQWALDGVEVVMMPHADNHPSRRSHRFSGLN